MNISGFQFRLTLSYFLIILISFGIIAFILDRSLEKRALQDVKTSLTDQAYIIESQPAVQNLLKEDNLSLKALIKTLGQKVKCRITIVDKNGKVIADSERTDVEIAGMENHSGRPEIKEALLGNTGENTHYSATLKMEMLYIAVPIKTNSEIIGAARLSLPLLNVRKILLSVRKSILMSLFIALSLALVLSVLFTGSVVNPINKIIYAARKFSTGDFSHKIFVDSKDEIGGLAAALNSMAGSLEEKIREVNLHNQYLKAILESMIEGIIVTDKSGHIISVNKTVEKIFNVKREGCEGKLLLEAIRNNDIDDIVKNVLKNGKFISRELSLVLPVQKQMRINASSIYEKSGVSGCLLVIHDITETRRLETMRGDFVANVSHELKTPLTSIKGFIETLLEGAIEDKENGRQFLKIIQNHSERLNNLVNDLLELSHLESREIFLEKEKVNLKDMADHVLSGFKSQLKKRPVKVVNEIPGGLAVNADKNKIEQVFTNLIDNAIKFNKEDGVINIYAEDAGDHVKIVVEDSGIGVPQKDIPRIFERFYRVDKGRSRELGGTGLGLSIVKHIVTLHGGSVGVESVEGAGSKFWFILPR